MARKYGIDYSLKKEVGADPPKFLVFFKAKDVDVMTAAFREYAGVELKKKQSKKPSVRKKLQKSVERTMEKVHIKTLGFIRAFFIR